ncbi:MAG: MBL fold metallo-hydrolase [Eubacterium sp.]|nr:MBL fold metallo-hydrolase [Eubacterium sp.]
MNYRSIKKQFSRIGFLFVMAMIFYFNPYNVLAGELNFHAIYVGSGDCLILESNHHYMLVDSGFQDTTPEVLAYLDALNIPDNQIDYAVATHPDGDHVGGFASIFDHYKVKQIIYSPCTKESSSFTDFIQNAKDHHYPLRTPIENETWKLGDATVEVVYDGFQGTTYNECSIVLRVTCDGKSILLTGDLPSVMENSLMKQGYNFKADVLKVGHHGAGSSTCSAFLDAVKPQYAVISSSAAKTAQLPRASMLIRLAKRFIKTYRTTDGNVLLTIKDGKIHTNHPENNGYISISKGTITLNQNVLYTTGKSLKPTVTLTVNGKIVPKNQYTVSYSSNKYPGKATVKVKGKNIQYVSSVKKQFLILPKKEKLKAVLKDFNSIVLTWDSQRKISGYTIVYTTDKSFKTGLIFKQISKPETLKKTFKKLAYGETYYFRMRAYISNLGYGKWSSIRSVKTKKNPKPMQEVFKVAKYNKKKQHIYLTWKHFKKDQATGFQIQYCTKKNFKKNVKKLTLPDTSVYKVRIKDIQKKKKYYVRIRGFNQYKKGEWSKTKRIRTR